MRSRAFLSVALLAALGLAACTTGNDAKGRVDLTAPPAVGTGVVPAASAPAVPQ